MNAVSGKIRLASGIDASKFDQLAGLIESITGKKLQNPPVLAAALLLSDPDVQHVLRFPKTAPDQCLIHDYQSVENFGDLQANVTIIAECNLDPKPTGAEFDLAISQADKSMVVSMKSALRIVPSGELAAAEPLAQRPAVSESLKHSEQMKVSQQQVKNYLKLSGDTNPLHFDTRTIEELRLRGPIVPGMLILGLIQPIIEQLFPGRIRKMKARFAAPIYVGQSFQLSADIRSSHKARVFAGSEGAACAIVDLTLDEGN